MKTTARALASLLALILWWSLPDYQHPIRYSLRAAGLERQAGY